MTVLAGEAVTPTANRHKISGLKSVTTAGSCGNYEPIRTGRIADRAAQACANRDLSVFGRGFDSRHLHQSYLALGG
jgi:hypothetical protein